MAIQSSLLYDCITLYWFRFKYLLSQTGAQRGGTCLFFYCGDMWTRLCAFVPLHPSPNNQKSVSIFPVVKPPCIFCMPHARRNSLSSQFSCSSPLSHANTSTLYCMYGTAAHCPNSYRGQVQMRQLPLSCTKSCSYLHLHQGKTYQDDCAPRLLALQNLLCPTLECSVSTCRLSNAASLWLNQYVPFALTSQYFIDGHCSSPAFLHRCCKSRITSQSHYNGGVTHNCLCWEWAFLAYPRSHTPRIHPFANPTRVLSLFRERARIPVSSPNIIIICRDSISLSTRLCAVYPALSSSFSRPTPVYWSFIETFLRYLRERQMYVKWTGISHVLEEEGGLRDVLCMRYMRIGTQCSAFSANPESMLEIRGLIDRIGTCRVLLWEGLYPTCSYIDVLWFLIIFFWLAGLGIDVGIVTLCSVCENLLEVVWFHGYWFLWEVFPCCCVGGMWGERL